jgi:hypothetical protein
MGAAMDLSTLSIVLAVAVIVVLTAVVIYAAATGIVRDISSYLRRHQ